MYATVANVHMCLIRLNQQAVSLQEQAGAGSFTNTTSRYRNAFSCTTKWFTTKRLVTANRDYNDLWTPKILTKSPLDNTIGVFVISGRCQPTNFSYSLPIVHITMKL